MQVMYANLAYSNKRGKDMFMYFRDIPIYPRWLGLNDEVFNLVVSVAPDTHPAEYWGWLDIETQKIRHITHDRIALTMDLEILGLDHKKGRLVRVAIDSSQKIFPIAQ